MAFRSAGREKLLSDAAWSLAPAGASLLAGLVQVKVLTTALPASSYGQASLVLGAIALLSNVLINPVLTTHTRLYFDYLQGGLAVWYARRLWRVLGLTACVAFTLYLLAAGAYGWYGNAALISLAFPAAALIASQLLFAAVTSFLESHRLQRRLAFTSILFKINCIVFLLALLPLGVGPQTLLYAQALAGLPALLNLPLIRNCQGTFREPECSATAAVTLRNAFLAVGPVLAAVNVAQWVLSTSDRYVIGYFLAPEDVGIYSMNYGLWYIPYAMTNGWLEVFTRPMIFALAVKQDWSGVKRLLLKRCACGLGICLLGTILLAFVGERIGIALLGKYWFNSRLMMEIAVGHCFFVVGYSVLPVFLAAKRTRGALVAATAAAACNALLNFWLVPSLGIEGAGWATLASYVVWAVFCCVLAWIIISRLEAANNGNINREAGPSREEQGANGVAAAESSPVPQVNG